MTDINLKILIEQSPDCVTNGAKLRAILLDIYPDIAKTKAIVNTLVAAVNLGIFKEIADSENITELNKSRWQQKLENEGFSEKIIDHCFKLLYSCVGCRKTNANNNVGTISLPEHTVTTQNTLPASEQASCQSGKTTKTITSSETNLKNIAVGSIIKFGSYWQGKSQSDGKTPIEWRVLAIGKKKALLISEYALNSKPYSSILLNTPWEHCVIRTWLNTSFLKGAFETDEQAQIISMPFLLDADESNKYFGSNVERQCVPTEYANANGIYHTQYTDQGKITCYWWLRSHTNEQGSVAYVTNYGVIVPHACRFDCLNIGIRPALWIQIDAGEIRQEPFIPSNKLIYCTVIYLDSVSYFNRNPKQYYYISDDPSIKVGDHAIVTVGINNEKKEVIVQKVTCYSSDYPFPPEKTKHIYRKL